MRKTILLVLAALVLSGSAAASFGSFTPDPSRQVDGLNASYRMGLVNTGNTTREVELTARAGPNISVFFDRRRLELEPSRTADSPAGEGWLYTGDTYVMPSYVTVRAAINDSTVERNHSFAVDVVASVPGERTTGPEVVQAREHAFHLSSSSPALEPEEDDSGGGLFDIVEGTERTGDEDDERATDEDGRTGGQQKNITGETAAPTGETGIDTVTVVLAAAIVLTTASILRELL